MKRISIYLGSGAALVAILAALFTWIGTPPYASVASVQAAEATARDAQVRAIRNSRDAVQRTIWSQEDRVKAGKAGKQRLRHLKQQLKDLKCDLAIAQKRECKE